MFYVSEIQKLKNGQEPASMLGYASKEIAMSAAHTALASCYAATDLSSFVVYVTDSFGNMVFKEQYIVPIPPNEEDTEQE